MSHKCFPPTSLSVIHILTADMRDPRRWAAKKVSVCLKSLPQRGYFLREPNKPSLPQQAFLSGGQKAVPDISEWVNAFR